MVRSQVTSRAHPSRVRHRLPALAAIALAATVAACSSSSGSSHKPSASAQAKPPSGQSSASASGSSAQSSPAALPSLTVSHPTAWLCRPGMADNPCAVNLDTTVIAPDGSRSVQHTSAATDPKIDCFYIYPTVSTATTLNQPLKPEPTIVATARAQVARFASVCRLFVPLYRQVTVYGLTKGGLTGPPRDIADRDVDSAWHDYLLHDNNGRGVIVIGHSQGGGEVLRLLRDEIEKTPAESSRLVAAYAIGANVLVPKGKDVGGDLTSTPACRTMTQHDCVVAYSSFDTTPPPNALFGRPPDAFQSTVPAARRAQMQVLCVNPAAPGGGTAFLHPYLPRPGGFATGSGTGFLAYPDQVRANCRTGAGASWLQIDHPTAGPAVPPISVTSGAIWGLHRLDMNLAQGDLVNLAAKEAAAWPS